MRDKKIEVWEDSEGLLHRTEIEYIKAQEEIHLKKQIQEFINTILFPGGLNRHTFSNDVLVRLSSIIIKNKYQAIDFLKGL